MVKQGAPPHLMPLERIESKILLLRGEKVLLSTHLAELYEVEPRALVQALKRNLDRFPADFMFQLSANEFRDLKSQIVTSSWGGLRRAAPYAFTEQGVAMLSSVLKGKRAIQVNVAIMRAFVRLRRILATHKDLAAKFEDLERRVDKHAADIKLVSQIVRQLLEPAPEPPKRPIGFRVPGN
jgi:phage regulator Rha-like protein